MKKTTTIFNYIYASICIVGLFMTSIQAWISPKDVMKLVKVSLDNNDAISSIRGIYAGVGTTIFIALSYGIFKNIRLTVAFLTVFWLMYSLSRIITIIFDGSLGDFGNQWLVIESSLTILGLIILILNANKNPSR